MTVCNRCITNGGGHSRPCFKYPAATSAPLQTKEEPMSDTTQPEAAAHEFRHTPVQARSQKRLESILVAARQALAINGRDRFTTQQVADLAGTSIGTIYRYFPDRIAILDVIFPDRDQTLPEEVKAA